MRKTQQPSSKKDWSRPVLGMAIGLLVMGCGLLVASLMLDSNPRLQAVSNGLRQSVPYPLLLGFVFLVLYVVVRPVPDKASQSRTESAFYGRDTTDFASRLDRDAAEDTSRDELRR
jgi:hypothetical protein